MGDCGPKRADEKYSDYDARMRACEQESGGDGKGTWALVEGSDGRMYERNSTTGEKRLAPKEFQPKQDSVSLGYRTASDYGDRSMGRGGYDAPITTYIGERDIPLDSGLARQAAMTGGLGLADSWKVFADAGLPDSLIKDFLLGDTSGGGGGGSGVGYAQLAQRQAEFEYEKQRQKQRDSVADAMALFDAIAGQAQMADARAKIAKENQLAAMPWAVDPGQSHFSGLTPDSAIVRYGLTDPVKITHQRFDPSLPVNQYDAAVADALATFRRVSGA